MKKSKIIISIVICTYNHYDDLIYCIDSINDQNFSNDKYEVLVIDNNSLDKTSELIKNYIKNYPNLNIKYIKENQIGLGKTRNRGYKLSKGMYVAYLDDDVKIPKNWLTTAVCLIKKYDNSIHALGGPEKPFFISKKNQEWFKSEYAVMSEKTLGSQEKYLKNGESLTGSNMIIRKNILAAVGGFDEQLGMKGESLYLHEETDLFYRIFKRVNNAKILYSPRLFIFHEVSDKKQTLSYILQRSYVGGCAWFDMRNRKKTISRRIVTVFLAIGYVVFHTFYSAITFITYSRWQNWVAERVSKIMFGLGYIANGLHFRIRIKQIR